MGLSQFTDFAPEERSSFHVPYEGPEILCTNYLYPVCPKPSFVVGSHFQMSTSPRRIPKKGFWA